MAIKKPSYWLKHWHARRAVIDYPLYDVPHKGNEREGLSEADVRENFEYFMRVRHERLAFFNGWISKNFRLDLSFDGESAIALARWVDDYGGGLLGDRPDFGCYRNYQPVWRGGLSGYNVVFDIGIFLGEYLIARRPHLHWNYRGITFGDFDPDDDTFEPGRTHPFVDRPFIDGFTIIFACSPLYTTIGDVLDSWKRSELGQSKFRAPRSGLLYKLRAALHIANVPKPREGEVSFFGDYSNEPLS